MSDRFPRDSVEAVIASRWLQITGTPPASIDEDFFDAGHSSLDAVRLMRLLREEFGEELSIQAIFDVPDIVGLARVIRDGGGHRRYVFKLQDGDGVPLVLGPGLGGGPAYISKLAIPRLGRPVFSVITKGVHGEAAPYRTVEETSRHLRAELRGAGVSGPVHFLGHCMGGNSVLHAAREAASYGLETRSVVLINTSPMMPELSRRQMTKIRLQEIRGFAGLADDPAIDALPDDEPLDGSIHRVFAEVQASGAIWESEIDAFKVRLDVYVSSWQAAATFEHAKFDGHLAVMYDPAHEDWLYGGRFDTETWSRSPYPGLTLHPRPGMTYAGIGEPDHIAAVAAYLDEHDAADLPVTPR